MITSDVHFLVWAYRKRPELLSDSYLSYLVVSRHQVLNCLSIYGGYLLDVRTFLLLSAHMGRFTVQLCIKAPLERIRCPVQNIPDLMVPELQ